MAYAFSTKKNEVHTPSRCRSCPWPPCPTLCLQKVRTSRWECALLRAFHNFFVWGPRALLPKCFYAAISWRSEKHIKMWNSGLQGQTFHFSQWCSAASLGPLLGHLVAYPLVLLSVSNIWGWNDFLELTEIRDSWKMGLVPRDEKSEIKVVYQT